MKIHFQKLSIQPNVEYSGVVEEIKIIENKERIRIYVTLEEFQGESFMKSLQFSENRNGQAGRFFDELGLMDSKGIVDLEELQGREVLVTLSQGNDMNWYVDKMYLLDDSDDDIDDEEDDEEDDIDDEDDDEEDEMEDDDIEDEREEEVPQQRQLGGLARRRLGERRRMELENERKL